MKFKIYCIALLISCLSLTTVSAQSQDEIKLIEKEVMEVAKNWTSAWNGKIDADKMMALYHPDMKYFWRGTYPPGNYVGFKKFLMENFSQTATYDISISNPDVTVIDYTSAIVFFQFNDKNEDPFGSGAATLVMTKDNSDWKVLYVHESSVQEQ
ncbi:nuclear transport factor 2 family protein [Aegicerativicinus sediminis]|uniref:nuclear transport factor 2 family protein n=1 Tax=Aegicerativicinus sediminis TaxID=2893202 RepID=UPI001E5A719A|nr:nuclear transport factor 2 family protein [Aegicerativicinus sediminis]